MLINQTKRIYMNEADGSSGNGAPTAPPAPAAPVAEPTAPTLDVDALMTRIVSAVDERFAAKSNELFANARKAGLLKKEETPPAPAAAPSSNGLTAVEVEQM